MNIIEALKANGHITTGANIAPRRPKNCTISIEEANECTDNYSKKLCTDENPYYHIETDYLDSEGLFNAPSLNRYDRVTGKPVPISAFRQELRQRQLMWESTR